MPPLLWHVLFERSLSLSLSFCFRHASSSSSFVCVVVVFVCVAFVLCFWSSKTHTILGREKEKERINPTQTLNPKKHTKTHVKKREKEEVLEREKNTRACFSTYYSPFMTPKESATKQTPSIPPPPPPPPQQSLLSSSFSVSSKKSVFLGLLRKARTERRANLATQHLRRGEFARYFRETTTKKMSPIALAAKATEMTRTQKRINRGGY